MQIKTALHLRNQHRERYDFNALIISYPPLASFVKPNTYVDASIDFANPQAVIALNKALLLHHYGVQNWHIPKDYLCPPIPGRADYIHYIDDLLGNTNKLARVLDIGVGANMVYPLIGNFEYGWQFVGADIDAKALENAHAIIKANPSLATAIELRLQTNSSNYFKNIIKAGELFDITLCNPPFHASFPEAEAGTRRKLTGLSKGLHSQKQSTALNFGGNTHELIYAGGEAAFVCGMVAESKSYATQVRWFSSLISKEKTLPAVYRALKQAGAIRVETINMAQGQKKSRFVAWTFVRK